MLGIARDADEKTVKNAFRTLAMQYHPDRNKSPQAEARFKEIAEAYAVLSDPGKRAAYNVGGVGSFSAPRPEDIFSGVDFAELFDGLGFDFGGNLFERFFGSRYRRPRPPCGENIEVALHVPLERIMTGGEAAVDIELVESCAMCKGSGARPGCRPRICEACNGTGSDVHKRQDSGMLFQQVTPCAACGGRGAFIDDPCGACHGQGLVSRKDTVKVNLPAGIEEGMTLRVPARGKASVVPHAPAGDLYVVVHSQPDPRFERDGADLLHTLDLALTDAVLGVTLSVPALDGDVRVTIAAGTQPGTVLRQKGRGLPHFGRMQRGDLLLKVRVVVPAKLSDAERALYEQLRRLRA